MSRLRELGERMADAAREDPARFEASGGSLGEVLARLREPVAGALTRGDLRFAASVLEDRAGEIERNARSSESRLRFAREARRVATDFRRAAS